MTSLTIDLASLANIDARTRAAYALHHTAGSWMHTQVWTWEGGDAVVVTVGEIGNVNSWFFVRLGDKVHAICERATGIAQVLKAFGYETQVAVR